MRAARLRVTGALLAAPLVLLAAFYAWPLAQALLALTPDGLAWLAAPYARGRLAIALAQAALSALLTLALALPLAWHHHARAIPFGRAHLALHAAPFVLPVFVVVYGLQLTLGDALGALGPFAAVVLAHAYYNYGFAARLLHATLERRPRRLEEAAQTLGATPRAALWRVTLPLLAPSIAAVALLAFLFTFSSFGVVLLLGAGEVSTPETLMVANLGGAFPRIERAAALGALQLALALALLLAYGALLRRARGVERDPTPRRLPARPVDVAVSALAAALCVAPIVAVLVGGFRLEGAWSLEPWRALLDASHPAHLAGFSLARALGLSLLYAVAATLVALALAALFAYGGERLGGWPRRALDAATAAPLGTSSLLLGFGFLLAFGAGDLLDLRGSPVAIVLVHALVAFPFAARVVLPAFAARDRRLDEAAALLGAPPTHVARRVHLPLLAGTLAAAAGLCAAISLGDFGASFLLMRPDNMALSVWIARHDVAFNPLLKAQALALTGLLALLAASCYLAAERARGGEAP